MRKTLQSPMFCTNKIPTRVVGPSFSTTALSGAPGTGMVTGRAPQCNCSADNVGGHPHRRRRHRVPGRQSVALKSSIIMTTNRSITEGVRSSAIPLSLQHFDRSRHSSVVIDISGNSYRLRDHQAVTTTVRTTWGLSTSNLGSFGERHHRRPAPSPTGCTATWSLTAGRLRHADRLMRSFADHHCGAVARTHPDHMDRPPAPDRNPWNGGQLVPTTRIPTSPP